MKVKPEAASESSSSSSAADAVSKPSAAETDSKPTAPSALTLAEAEYAQRHAAPEPVPVRWLIDRATGYLCPPPAPDGSDGAPEAARQCAASADVVTLPETGRRMTMWPPAYTAHPMPLLALSAAAPHGPSAGTPPLPAAWWSCELDRHLLVAAHRLGFDRLVPRALVPSNPNAGAPAAALAGLLTSAQHGWMLGVFSHGDLPFRSIVLGGGWPKHMHGPAVADADVQINYSGLLCPGVSDAMIAGLADPPQGSPQSSPHAGADTVANNRAGWEARVGFPLVTVISREWYSYHGLLAAVGRETVRQAQLSLLQKAATEDASVVPGLRYSSHPNPLRDRYAGVHAPDSSFRAQICRLAAPGVHGNVTSMPVMPPLMYPVVPLRPGQLDALATAAVARLHYLLRTCRAYAKAALLDAAQTPPELHGREQPLQQQG